MNTRMKMFGVAAVSVLTGCVADATSESTKVAPVAADTALAPTADTRVTTTPVSTVPSEIFVQLCDDADGFDPTYGDAIAAALGERGSRELDGGLITEIGLPGFDPATAEDPAYLSVKLANADGSAATGPAKTIRCTTPVGESEYHVGIVADDGTPLVASWPKSLELGSLKAGFAQDGTRSISDLTFELSERDGAGLEGAVGMNVTARIDRLPRSMSRSTSGSVATASWTMHMTITESSTIANTDGTTVRKVRGNAKYGNIVLKRGSGD